MKPRLLVVLFGLFCGAILPAAEPAEKPPVLVSVHGAWAGGWQMKKVAPILEARGWKVYRPSLPGLGEHYHLATPNIGLEDHITDIVNLILFEDLHDVILLGHSYGGMVITGVADRIPERIARLVYLDAFVPNDGESLVSLRGPGLAAKIDQMAKNGFLVPNWVAPDKPFPKDVPHPVKTTTDSIVLKNQAAAAKIPATYILTVDPGKQPADDDFFAASERARARGWPVIIMAGDHVVNWRQPEALAKLILDIR